jgi:hypothetical protein
MKFRIEATECEHYGNVEFIASDIRSSGGRVLDSSLDIDEEMAYFVVEVEDDGLNNFKSLFNETESSDFCTLGRY